MAAGQTGADRAVLDLDNMTSQGLGLSIRDAVGQWPDQELHRDSMWKTYVKLGITQSYCFRR